MLMTLHYHGGPFTPIRALYELAGRCMCISFARPEQIERMKEIAQIIMHDNGAFNAHLTAVKMGLEPKDRDWTPFYAWTEQHQRPGDWAVIPDVIDGGSQLQDALLKEWPHGRDRGAPVWHMDESIARLLRLVDEWPRVCIGSTAEYWKIDTPAWHGRMTDAWNQLSIGRRFTPNIHMLRGMSLVGGVYPFASVDSTDIAQNHHRAQNTPVKMANRWDAIQCPARWTIRALQGELIA